MSDVMSSSITEFSIQNSITSEGAARQAYRPPAFPLGDREDLGLATWRVSVAGIDRW